ACGCALLAVGAPWVAPTGMRNPDIPGGGVPLKSGHQVDELPLCPSADQLAVVQRADAGAVVAAVFHPPEAVDEAAGDCFFADDADDSTHGPRDPWSEQVGNADSGHRRREIPDVAGPENAAVFLARSQPECGAEPDAGLFVTQVGRAAGDLGRDLADREVGEEALGFLARGGRRFAEDLEPADPAKPWPFGATQFRGRLQVPRKSIDHHPGIEIDLTHLR